MKVKIEKPAKMTGCEVVSIQYYEKAGLIQSGESGVRPLRSIFFPDSEWLYSSPRLEERISDPCACGNRARFWVSSCIPRPTDVASSLSWGSLRAEKG